MNRATKTALTAALPFMMLPLTVAGPLPTAGAAAVELPSGPATVLHTGPTLWSTPNNLGGIICELERECREVYYQWVLPLGTFEPGVAENVKNMNFALNNTEGNKIAYGFSGGARVVSKWLEDNADSTAISPEELSVVLLGNGGRKYGGINGWFYRDSLMTPTDTQFSVVDVAREYDPIADFPDNPFNLLALANAISAFGNVHMKYSEADLNAPGNYVWTEGNTTYVFIPTSQLPLLAGLRSWGLGAIADQLEAPLREIIDKAYNREYLDDAEIIGEEDEDDSNPVQPVAAAIPTGPGEACSGYNTDGCDIDKEQSYTPITAPDFDNAAWQNVLPNLFNALISVPRAYLDGLNDLSHALEVTGSWWVYTPTNVLGYDPADPPKITAVTNLLIPFKPLSNALGEHVSWWAKANLPMDAGCTGTAPPTCKDANSILSKMFLAPIWDLISGYKFPELNNPVSEEEGAAGEEIPGQTGTPVPWSGEAVQLNPWDPVYNTLNYLFAPPEQNRPKPITLTEVVESVVRFGKALWLDFNPFVPGSFLWKGYPYTLVTPFIKPFVKLLCPSCDPENPGDPTPFGEQPEDGEEQGAQTTEGTEDTAQLVSSKTEEGTEGDDVESTAINDLLEKFKLAPQEDEAAPVDEKSGDEVTAEQPADEVTAETPADDEGKTESGTPAETKPDTGVDEGKDEVGEPTETEDQTAEEDQDKGAVAEDSEKPSTGGKHRKDDTADASNESQDKASESTSGADAKKESAGASSGGSDSGE